MAIEVAINGNTTNLDAKLAETRRKVQETAERGASAASAAGSALGAISGEMGALGGAVGAAGGMIAQVATGPVGMLIAGLTLLVTVGVKAWDTLTQSAEEYGSVLDKLANKYDALQKKNDAKKKSSESYMERISAIDARGNLATDAEKKERTQLLALLARNYGGQQEGESRGDYFSRIRGLAIQTETKDAIRQYGSAKRQTSFAIDAAADSIGPGKWWEKDALRNLMKGLSPEQLSEYAYKKMHKATTQGEIDAWEKLAKAAQKEAEKKRELDNLNMFGSRSEADVAARMRKESDAAQKAQQDAAAKAKAEKQAQEARDKARSEYEDANAKSRGFTAEERRNAAKLVDVRIALREKREAFNEATGTKKLQLEKEIYDLLKKELALEREKEDIASRRKAATTARNEAYDAYLKDSSSPDEWVEMMKVSLDYLRKEIKDAEKRVKEMDFGSDERIAAEKELYQLKRKELGLEREIESVENGIRDGYAASAKTVEKMQAQAAGGVAYAKYLQQEIEQARQRMEEFKQSAAELAENGDPASLERMDLLRKAAKAQAEMLGLEKELAGIRSNGEASAGGSLTYHTNDLTRRGGGIGLAVPEREITDITRQILEQNKQSNSNQRDILSVLNNLGVRI